MLNKVLLQVLLLGLLWASTLFRRDILLAIGLSSLFFLRAFFSLGILLSAAYTLAFLRLPRLTAFALERARSGSGE